MVAPRDWLPFFLQTADPLFPTGAYAHSLGFEEAVRLAVVTDEASLRRFLLLQIVPAQAHHELPYLRFAFDAASAGDLAELVRIDREINAWKLAGESRLASAQLGLRRLTTFSQISDHPLVSALLAEISASRASGHHLTVCALHAVIDRVPLEAALTGAFYQALSSVCSAAMKLIRIGQDGCQRALREACAHGASAVATSSRVSREEAGWFNPVIEIASMRHERAEERLFIS